MLPTVRFDDPGANLAQPTEVRSKQPDARIDDTDPRTRLLVPGGCGDPRVYDGVLGCGDGLPRSMIGTPGNVPMVPRTSQAVSGNKQLLGPRFWLCEGHVYRDEERVLE